jgi:arylsulfatase A-like enzyme
MPPNVLVLVFDTARADVFEPYGAPAGSTPAVQQLASSGRAIDDVFAASSWTLPSHVAMFTGMMPRALGLTQAPGGAPHGSRPVLEAREDRLLPAVLRRAGYETRGVSANLWVSPISGFATGFDQFEVVNRGSRVERVERDDVRGRFVWALEGLRAREDDGALAAEATLAHWLAEPREKPFFWFANLMEAHSPYLPPRPYNDLGPIGRIQAANEARRYLTLGEIWRACLSDFHLPDAAVRRMRHLYNRSVSLLDDWLARLLQRLDDHGVLDDTLVIVTSDHGENFGEGGLLAHAFSVDDRLIRVPFVINRADFAPADGATSLVQLPSLLADYLGIDDHPWRTPALPASCATAQFDFVDEDDPRIETAANAWDLDEEGRARLSASLTCATDGDLKLLLRGDTEELYDLTADPLELQPLSPSDHPDTTRVAALRKAVADPAVQAREMSTPAVAPEPDDVEEIEARMKLLGYM